MRGNAAGIHESSSRVWIDGTILAAAMEEHQLSVVFELNPHPVPSHLIGLKLVREEFVVHPGRARHFKPPAGKLNFSIRVKACQRDVVGTAACPFGFLAHAVLAVNYRGLCGSKRELKRKVFINGLQNLIVTAPCDLPIAIPDSVLRITYPGNAGSRAVCAFRMKKRAVVQIA